MFCRHEYMRTVTGTSEAGSGSLDLEAQRAVTAICQSSQCSELLSPLSSLTSDHWVVFEEQYRCARFVAEPLVTSFIISSSRLSFKCEESAWVQEFGLLGPQLVVPFWKVRGGGPTWRKWATVVVSGAFLPVDFLATSFSRGKNIQLPHILAARDPC